MHILNRRYYHYAMVYILIAGASGCQYHRPMKPQSNTNLDKMISQQTHNRTNDVKQLTLCQEQLEALSKIDREQYAHFKKSFDNLMKTASTYSHLRSQVNIETQKSVDALYLYKVSFMCAEINQAVLIGLASHGENIK
ncbi:hypothetical protein ACSN7O_004678 [Enterobacter chuandaensis]